jgi:hypothetical protein
MGTPTTNGTKTIRVSEDTHRRFMDMAQRQESTADDTLLALMGESTVRIPLSDIQRKRWSDAAAQAGVTLQQFVVMRVEAALQWGADPSATGAIYGQVQEICRFLGMRRRSVDSSTPKRPTPGETTS